MERSERSAMANDQRSDFFGTQQGFWDEWSDAYRGFSETIAPYRDAQRAMARAAVLALGEDARRDSLRILDAGGGAGNLIGPLLEELAARRGNLAGVSYLLTDGSGRMAALAGGRVAEIRSRHPGVALEVRQADTLDDGYESSVGVGAADLVTCGWNVEYYLPAARARLVNTLARVARPDGTVAFSGAIRLPEGLIFKDVLMPLGAAQVFHALLTGGPAKMKKVTRALGLIKEFAIGAASVRFPVKPTLAELKDLAAGAGLSAAVAEYCDTSVTAAAID